MEALNLFFQQPACATKSLISSQHTNFSKFNGQICIFVFEPIFFNFPLFLNESGETAPFLQLKSCEIGAKRLRFAVRCKKGFHDDVNLGACKLRFEMPERTMDSWCANGGWGEPQTISFFLLTFFLSSFFFLRSSFFFLGN